MSTYTPDCWEILKISSPEYGDVFKIIAGWYGGFAGANSWKLSSGIEKVIEHDDYYEMPQSSGSTYICYRGCRKMNVLMMSVFDNARTQLAESDVGTMELLSDVDPMEIL